MPGMSTCRNSAALEAHRNKNVSTDCHDET